MEKSQKGWKMSEVEKVIHIVTPSENHVKRQFQCYENKVIPHEETIVFVNMYQCLPFDKSEWMLPTPAKTTSEEQQ